MLQYLQPAPMTSFGERGGRLRHIAYVLSLLLGLGLSLGLFAPELQAQSSSGTIYTVERVPKVFAQDSLQLFSDPESYMSPNVRDVLNALLTELRSDTGVECAVVLLPSIGERDIEGFATELFRSWGIGSRTLNDGLLILLVLDQRKVRFEVGYGLEGTLPDAVASRIQRQVMIPLLRQGHYADALIMGVEAVKQELIAAGYRSDRHTARGPSSEGLGLDSSALLYLYILIVAIIAFSLVNNLQGVVYQAQRGQRQLLLSYPSLRRTYRIWAVVLCVLCLPVGILYYIYMQRRLQEIEQRLSRCPHCQVGLLEQLSPEESYSYLTQPQRLETALGSRRYVAFACPECHERELVGEDLSSHWSVCRQCQARTAEVVGQRRIRVEGIRYIRTELRCRNCGESDHRDYRDNSTDDAALGAMLLGGLLSGGRHRGGGFGGGGFGGGFGGGSFGGGSSGGGGATSGW